MSEIAYDFDGLDEWEHRLTQQIENQYPEEFRKMVIDVAVQLEGRVKENTPVKTGRLRNAWHIGQIQKRGNEYYIEVYNNMEYVEAVEHGHRQEVGRYVPAIGKRLKAGFVPGAHMMEISMIELQQRLPGYLKEWLNDFLNGLE